MVLMVFAGFDGRFDVVFAAKMNHDTCMRCMQVFGTLGFQKPTQGVVGKSDRVQQVSTLNRLT